MDDTSSRLTGIPLARATVSAAFATLSAALLVYAALTLIFMWSLAARDGVIPRVWGVYDGNHGPWRRLWPYRAIVWNVIWTPFWSLNAACLSWLVKPGWKATALAITSVAAFVLLLWSHYWLVD
jgi:hypothetical protein